MKLVRRTEIGKRVRMMRKGQIRSELLINFKDFGSNPE